MGGTTAGVRPLTRRAAEVMLPAASGAWHERDRTRAEIAPNRPLYRLQTLRRFGDDRSYIPLKLGILAALFLLASVI